MLCDVAVSVAEGQSQRRQEPSAAAASGPFVARSTLGEMRETLCWGEGLCAVGSGFGIGQGQRDQGERGRQYQRRAAERGRGDRAAEQPGERQQGTGPARENPGAERPDREQDEPGGRAEDGEDVERAERLRVRGGQGVDCAGDEGGERDRRGDVAGLTQTAVLAV